MERLHEDIAELFAGLDGYDRSLFDEAWFAAQRSRRQQEYNRRWEARHPAKHKAIRKATKKRYRKSTKGRAAAQRRRDRHRDHMRALWQKSSKRYYAKHKKGS